MRQGVVGGGNAYTEVIAMVIRKDGTIENLGVIARSKLPWYRRLWKGVCKCLRLS